MNGGEGYSCNGWLKPQSTFIPGDTTVPVPSSELGPPIPSPASECAPPPPESKGGYREGREHTRLRVRVQGSQFGRLEKKPSTLFCLLSLCGLNGLCRVNHIMIKKTLTWEIFQDFISILFKTALFICSPSDCAVLDDSGIEPKTANLQLQHRQSDALTTRLDLIRFLIRSHQSYYKLLLKILIFCSSRIIDY